MSRITRLPKLPDGRPMPVRAFVPQNPDGTFLTQITVPPLGPDGNQLALEALAMVDSVGGFIPLSMVSPASIRVSGALGDGSDDFAAINAAIVVAVAQGRALVVPEGDYYHSGTLNFGYANLRVIFEGKVSLRHTGTGKAISFDGGASVNQNLYGQHFGWGNPPTLYGNVNTTDLLYIRGCCHMKVDVRMRDCTTGCNIEFSVGSIFILRQTGNEGAFTVKQPTTALIVNKRAAAEATTTCVFFVIAEGLAGLGVDLVCAQGCIFFGTSEGNVGGVRVRVDSLKNTFSNFFCEQNGAAAHWNIEGNDNIFNNISGGAAANTGLNTNVISGIRNKFNHGQLYNKTTTGYYNDYDQVSLGGALVKGTNNIYHLCHDGAGGEISQAVITAPALAGLWVASTGVSIRAPGYWKDDRGYVHIVGGVKSGGAGSVIFTLPVGSRPGGTLWMNYYNAAGGITGQWIVAANGQVQHIAGDSGAVPLDVTFFAEN